MSIEKWAIKHHVSMDALRELAELMASYDVTPEVSGAPGSESRVQSQVRIEAAKAGYWLTRNNVGALRDSNGRFVRFGLANESAQQNAIIKSADLIGFRRRVIVSADIGTVIAQFVSRECKAEGWQFNPNDEHTQAQARWRDFIIASGGDACFVSGAGSFNVPTLPKLSPLKVK